MTETQTVPSAGTEPAKTPTPSVASEEAILQQINQQESQPPAAEPAEPAKPAGEEQPPTEEPKQPGEETKPQEPETPEGEEETPEAELETRPELPEAAFQRFKQVQVVGEDGKPVPLFKAFPELKRVLGRHEAFSELGSISELRDLRTKFPTVEDMERTVQAAEDLERFQTNPGEFLETLGANPEAFQAFAMEFPRILYRLNPQAYSQQVYGAMETVLTNLNGRAQKIANTELADAITTVSEALGIPIGAAGTPAAQDERDRQIAELKAKLEEKETNERSSHVDTFINTFEKGYMEQSLAEIKAAVEKAFPSIHADDHKDIVREIWESLDNTVGSAPQTKAHIQSVIRQVSAGKAGEKEHQALVEFLVKRAKTLLPTVSKPVFSKWARRLLSAQTQRTQKAQTVAATTKETAPQGGPAAPTQPAAPQIQRPKTERELFAEINST